jgi:hypothetical protein
MCGLQQWLDENKTRELLGPMIQDKAVVLDQQGQRIVAGWITLKSIIGEHETDMPL